MDGLSQPFIERLLLSLHFILNSIINQPIIVTFVTETHNPFKVVTSCMFIHWQREIKIKQQKKNKNNKGINQTKAII